MSLIKKIFFAFTLLFLVAVNVYSGDIPYHSRISYGYYGNVVVEIGNPEASSSIAITPGVGAYSDQNIRNYISLGIDHELTEFLGDAYDIEVDVKVDPFINGNAQASFTKTLKIGYHPFDKENYKDKDVYRFTNIDAFDYEIEAIRVITGSITTNVIELPKNIYLDGDIVVNRIGDFTSESNTPVTLIPPTLLDLDCDSNMQAEEVRIKWGTIGTATEYQLEWTFVNNYDGSKSGATFGVLPADSLNYNFKSNSTRITTANTYYDIPLVFESGYIMWRIRAVGYNPLNPTQLIFGVWSEQNTGGVQNFVNGNTNGYIINSTPHEVNKNWQLTTTFAEEGKKKEVVSYYDGSLRNRQSVTVVNTDKNVIVGETIYDNQGRPVINVLPVPVIRPGCNQANGDTAQASIKYYPQFNKSIDSVEYLTQKQFDFDVSNCGTNLSPMSDSTGASQYYSELNPNKVAHQAYVPDANGYPFTQVEYTPDNTGRIRRQSGVGEDFQLGSGHESKYYYGKPFQLKLDRLFASQVGYASHYKKNLVIDPNGQISVSYLDQEGRVIATALAGEAPDNLNEIQSLQNLNNAGGVDLVVDLFEKNANGISTNNILNVNEDALVFSQELLVSTSGNYHFSYDLTQDAYTDTCTPTLCYNCIYDLKLTLLDECGAVLNDVNTGNPIEYLVQEGYFIKDSLDNFSTFTTNCDNGGVYQSSTYDFTANLAVGNYKVIKKLTLNNNVVSNAFKAYLLAGQNSGCVDSLGAFKAEEIANIDLSGCDVSCDECVLNLGSLDDFVSNGLGTVNDYEALLEECKKPCTQPTFCETVFEILRADVSPGGQYGEYQVNGINNFSAFPLSVYNSSNVLPFNSFNTPNENWRNPSVTINGTTYSYYLDANGDSAKVFLTVIGSTVTPAVLNPSTDVLVDPISGLSYTYPTLLQNVEDFITEFEYSWSQSLVIYHPENCYYETCLSYGNEDVNENSSEAFDVLLRTTNTFQEAITRGLVVLNGSNYEVVDFSNTSSSNYDPFITSGSYGANGTSLSSLFSTYQIIGGTSYSMQEFAAISARCGNNTLTGSSSALTNCANSFGSFSGTPTTTNDDEWSIFKSLYLGKKREFQNSYEDAQALTGDNCLNDCIGNGDFNPYTSGMWQGNSFPYFNNNPYYNGDNACSIFKKGLYSNKTKRFPDNDDLQEQGNANNAGYQSYLQTGQCPKATYLQNFLKEIAADNKLTNPLISLMPYSSYGILYTDASNPTPLTNRFWQTNSTVGGVLNAMITDQSGDDCELNLFSNGQITDWNNVISFSGIRYTGINGAGLYEFEIIASLMDNSHVTVTGLTCIDIGNCTFSNVCKANDLALSVEAVFTLLASENKLVTTGYTLPASSPYITAASIQLLNQVGASAVNNITWSFDPNISSTGKFKNGNNEFQLKINSVSPTNFTNYGGIAYFDNIKSNYQHYFTIDAYDASGTFLVTLSGEAIKVVIGSNNITPIEMGSCELPTPIACSQNEHLLLNDLKDLLADVLITNNYNIFQSSQMTSLLTSYLGGTTASGSIVPQNSSIGGIVEVLTINITNSQNTTCEIIVYVEEISGYSFSDIISVDGIKAVGTITNNSFRDFELEVTVSNSPGQQETIIITGTSCLPLLNCELCEENTVELLSSNLAFFVVPPPSLYDNCDSLYLEYVAAYNTYWDSTTIPNAQFYIDNNYYPLLSYSQFENRYLCCSDIGISLLNDYLTSLTNYNSFPSGVPRRYECNNDTNDLGFCTTAYRLYLDRLLLHNDSNVNQYERLSFDDFSNLGYCDNDCIEYYLENYSNNVPLIDIKDYEYCNPQVEPLSDCEEKYNEYATIIVEYNEFVNLNQLGWPLITEQINASEFTNEKLCNCVDGYLAFLNTRIDSVITTAPTTEELNILTYCPKAPCLPDSVFNTDTITPIVINYINPCEEQAINIANLNAEIAYQQYINTLATDFIQNMKQHCLEVEENFTLDFNDKEYHYTLYYYDQAGNLEQTVPPEGVEMVGITSSLDAVSLAIGSDRLNNTQTIFTYHRLATKYKYNSLNQLTHQSLPDHDQMDIFEFSKPDGLDNKLTVQSIQFVTETKGYLSGFITYSGKERGILYTTNDGGLTWQKVNYTLGANLKAVSWVSNDTAYAVGSEGILIKSTNAGFTWDMIDTYTANVTTQLNDITMSSGSVGYAVGNKGTIIKINGTTVTPVIPNITDPNQQITVDDNITSITEFSNTLALTVNRINGIHQYGRGYAIQNFNSASPTWVQYSDNRLSSLTDIQAINSQNFVAVGNNGQFIKSDDAGDNWYLQEVDNKQDFKAIHFSSITEGIAIRENGTLYATYDGGESWTVLDNTKIFNGLHAYETTKVLLYGDNGTVARVIMNTGTNFGVVHHTTNFTTNLIAGSAVSNAGVPIIVVSSGNNQLYVTQDASNVSPTWSTFSSSKFSNILEIEVLADNNVAVGVIRDNNTDIYSFLVKNNNYFDFQLPVTNISAIAKRYDNDFFFAHQTGTGDVYIINKQTNNNVPPTNANVFYNSGITNALSNFDSHTNLYQLIHASINGEINRKTSFQPPTNQTKNIRSLPLNDFGIINITPSFIGDNGTIINKIDTNCIIIGTNDTENYNAIDIKTGVTILVGDKGLIRKYDNSNQPTTINANTTVNILSVAMSPQSNDVYYGTSAGTLLRTPDITATNINISTISSNSTHPIYGIDISPNGEVLYVGNESRIYKGSQNMAYEIKNSYTPKLVDAHFSSTQKGYVVGKDYTVRHTTNGGQTWNTILPSTDFSAGVPILNAIYTHPNGDAHLVGDNTYIAKINNNEATQLTSGIPPGTYPLHDVEFTDVNNGIAVGGVTSAQVWLTSNAGTTWNSATIGGSTAKLRAAHGFSRNNTYIAVGDNETMLYIKSINTVDDISSNLAGENLHDITFYDDVNGYAVGENGTLLKATNGSINQATGFITGLTWDVKSTVDDINPNGKNIYAIDYANRYAVSLGGVHATGNNYTRILRDESEQFSTYFWYDRLGRIVVSQNSKQFSDTTKRYSYTLYDKLGRVVQAGEKIENTNLPFKTVFGTYVSGLYTPKVIDDFKLNAWINNTTGKRQEVTRSYYDSTVADLGISSPVNFTQNQANLRKRISAITYEKVFDYGVGSQNTYDYGTFYEYDIHGNVKTLIQDNKELANNSNPDIAAQQYKRMDYEYDLISGNVHSVAYQKGEADAWYHKYTYDGDNRIETAQTSSDNINWDRDAKYIYYDHGPLARVEVGEHNVQGTDYVYTLQGWLKGVNSDLLNPNNDPGLDAINNGTNPNAQFAKDAMGFSLRYRENDYSPIDYTNKWQQESTRFVSVFQPSANSNTSDVYASRNNLYNGNIGAMVTTITKPQLYTATGNEMPDVLPQATGYIYDQLNRISQARAYQNIDTDVASLNYNTWQTSGNAYDNLYYNAFKYDASGNILTQERHDNFGNKIEDLVYHYGDNNGKRLQNRLYSVSDLATPADEARYTDDIEDMNFSNPSFEFLNSGSENYAYDEIGQLQQNKQEGIKEIKWRVDNKIKAIIREAGSSFKNIVFDYDPMGNRIAKHIYGNGNYPLADTNNFNPLNPTDWENTTYYRRDAQGNVMATYQYYIDTTSQTSSYKLIERNIYGSSRLGMNRDTVEMISSIPFDTTSYSHSIGLKQYECTNHLGNVLAVVTDRKFARDTNQDGTIDCYQPEIIKATDYSPFGVELYARNFTRDSIVNINTFINDSIIQFDEFTIIDSGGTYNVGDQANGFTHIFGTGDVTVDGKYKILDQNYGAFFYEIAILLAQKNWATLEVGSKYRLTFDVVETEGTVVMSSTITSNQTMTVGSKSYDFVANTPNEQIQFFGFDFDIAFGNPSAEDQSVTLDNLKLVKIDTVTYTNTVYASNYRYGFNGMEKDNETYKGNGNSLDFGARMYDSRLGRWLSIDKFHNEYIPISPYTFAMNKPIVFVDEDGNKIWDPVSKEEVVVTFDSEGNASFKLKSGKNVSESFMKNGGMLLKIISHTEIGRKKIEYLSNIPSKVDLKYKEKGAPTLPDGTKPLAQNNSYPGLFTQIFGKKYKGAKYKRKIKMTVWLDGVEASMVKRLDKDGNIKPPLEQSRFSVVKDRSEITQAQREGIIGAGLMNEIGDATPEGMTLASTFLGLYAFSNFFSINLEYQFLKEYNKVVGGFDDNFLKTIYETKEYNNEGELIKPSFKGTDKEGIPLDWKGEEDLKQKSEEKIKN